MPPEEILDKIEEFAEGLTKEEIDFIRRDEKLSKLAKSLQAGYTKKSQTTAGEKKQLETQLAQLQEGVQTRDARIQQWEEWSDYVTANPEALTGEGGDGDEVVDKGKKVKTTGAELALEKLQKQLGSLVERLAGREKFFGEELAKRDRMTDLMAQAFDLRLAHINDKDFDINKVLETALKKGYDDLGLSYKDTYHDSIIKKEVDTQVKAQLDSEKAKRDTDVESGKPEATLFRRPSEDKPAASWEERTSRVNASLGVKKD